MLKVSKIYLIMLILMSISVSSETIIINQLNLTENGNFTSVNITNYNISKSDFERLINFTNILIEYGGELTQEKKYLNSITERLSLSEKIFIDTLEESQASNEYLLGMLLVERNQSAEYKSITDSRLLTLSNVVQDLRNEIYKVRIVSWMKILLSILSTIAIVSFVLKLKKRKKLYFVLRWIRNKIPIRF